MIMVLSSVIHSSNSANGSDHDCDPPEEFVCPITQEVMQDPLMSRYGQSYEREAILTWLVNHNDRCPLTRKVLGVSDLIRNRSLETRIAMWHRARGIEQGSAAASSEEGSNGKENQIVLTCLRTELAPKRQSKSREKRFPRRNSLLGGNMLRLIRVRQ